MTINEFKEINHHNIYVDFAEVWTEDGTTISPPDFYREWAKDIMASNYYEQDQDYEELDIHASNDEVLWQMLFEKWRENNA